jgi:superfamily II RNA helicase
MTTLLHIPDAMTAPASWPPTEPLALPTKYELDPFQKHAVLAMHAGDHVFVTAKTGSGKTFVGEYLIARMLAAGKRVFYTTPIKSLSNQKYHDLKKLFPEATVGILTGDIKMCPDAQVVVMTAEILRNLFYKRGTATEGVGLTAAVSLEGVGGVVMDEVHYIQDPDRGHVWEETLILCPHDLQLVMLSATMPSAEALAGWIARIHQRRVWLLATTYRIVPLVHGMLTPCSDEGAHGYRVMRLLDEKGGWVSNAYTGWLKDRKAIEDAAVLHKKAVDARRRDGYAGGPIRAENGKVRVEDPIHKLRRTVSWLEATQQMPALFFVFSRKSCERFAGLVEGSLIDSSDSAAARHIIDFHLSRHRDTLEKSTQYHTVRDLLLRGIAFHHSGLQPLLKEIVEIMFSRGYVKVLFATETFSVGLNMPTKTVVFLELEKFSDGGMKRILRPDEYIQMAGRAGRRGLDKQGLVLYQPLREPVENYELMSLLTGALPALESRMRFHYDFILKHRLAGGCIPTSEAAGGCIPTSEAAGGKVTIAEQSYWAEQQKSARAGLDTEIRAAIAAVTAKEVFVPASAYADLEERDVLELALVGTVNAKRRKAQTALNEWDMEHDSGNWVSWRRGWASLKEARAGRDRLISQAEAWDSRPLLELEPFEACLQGWGFLDVEGEITDLGRCATEVNEGHLILMPLLAATAGIMDAVPATEIPCVLAAFLRESGEKDEEEAASFGANNLASETVAALHWCEKAAGAAISVERANRAIGPNNFWSLSRHWVSIVAAWTSGLGVSEIARDFDIFEGNVQRGLLRVANLLEEWAAIATLRSDLATLEKLNNLNFLRSEIVVDSLYLRL